MKKLFHIITVLLILAVPVRAELVRPDAAARYAKGVLGMSELPAPANTNPMRSASRDGRNDAPEYYVFNNPDGGWVIIAADDRVTPVIGYSDEGVFNTSGIPDNLQWWMDGVARVINDVRETGTDAPASVRAAWESLRAGNNPAAGVPGKYLPTALWRQTEPYNDLCPIAKGENVRSAVGCVATAMAIIMQYNQWPAHGQGQIGGYTTRTNKTYIQPYDLSDHTYDWQIMSDETVTKGKTWLWNSSQKQQVAQLMHDCGVSVQMDYSSEGSSATTGGMFKAIKNNMCYSDKTTMITRSSYPASKWMSLIQNEIDNGRVIFYGGVDELSGGHAFVCDGYAIDENDPLKSQLHINWGWGGDCNGYYPLDLTIESQHYKFSQMQDAVIGLAPDTADVVIEETISLVCMYYDGFYGIEPLMPADMTAGSEFNFNVGWFMNNSDQPVTAEFKICLEDKDGNIIQEGWNLKMRFQAADDYIYSDETAKTKLTSSPRITDRFRLYIKDSKEDWVPMNGNYELLPNVDGVVCGVTQDPLIIVPDGCTAGQVVDLELSLGFTHVKTVKWSVNGAALEDNRIKLIQGKNAIRADVVYLDGTTGSLFRTLQLE